MSLLKHHANYQDWHKYRTKVIELVDSTTQSACVINSGFYKFKQWKKLILGNPGSKMIRYAKLGSYFTGINLT